MGCAGHQAGASNFPDPESGGLVERRNGWHKPVFMPGRSFASRADFNEPLTEGL